MRASTTLRLLVLLVLALPVACRERRAAPPPLPPSSAPPSQGPITKASLPGLNLAGLDGGARAGKAAGSARLTLDLSPAEWQVVSRVTELAPREAAAPCQQDGDCQRVAADCCGFGGGGLCVAALVSQQARLAKLRQQRCAEVACVAVTSTDPSCLGRVTCLEGRCAVVVPPSRGRGGLEIKPRRGAGGLDIKPVKGARSQPAP